MQCPACDRELTEVPFGSVLVDLCADGCGGTWFDHFELSKVDEHHEVPGAAAPHSAHNQRVTLQENRKRRCPRCSNQFMRRRPYSPKLRVDIDECPSCGGIWLDAGELERIRAEVTKSSRGGSLSKVELTKLAYQYLTDLKKQESI